MESLDIMATTNEMISDDEESADPLGDLGDFDNFTDDETDDFGPTDCPYRVKEKIFFVPIDAFQTPISMGDLPSNVVPADHHQFHNAAPHGPPSPMLHALSPTHSPISSMNSIDRNNKNIHFRRSIDELQGIHPLHSMSPSPPFHSTSRPSSPSPPPHVHRSRSKSRKSSNSKCSQNNININIDPYSASGEIDLEESDYDSDDDGDAIDGLNLINYDHQLSDQEMKDQERNHEKKRSLLLNDRDSTRIVGRHSMASRTQHNVKGKGSAPSRTIQERLVSDFHPEEFDICLLVSAPLMIKNNVHRLHPMQHHAESQYEKNKSVRMHKQSTQGYNGSEALCEYIRSSLPDRLELQQTVRQTLVRHNIRMRYAHFTATCESLHALSTTFGGCKVLQFVGYCCNPHRDTEKWPQLCKSLLNGHYTEDCDYVLLETEVGTDSEDDNICCFGKGVWYTLPELATMLTAAQTHIECIIAMSPQHERLSRVFKELGYHYVIGVEAPNNSDPFPTTETCAFLDQFYAALLESRSVSRAYYLSLQAALSTRGGGGASDHDPKYLFHLDERLQDRKFIVFDPERISHQIGEIDDKSQHEKLPKTNLREPVRPFLGRSKYVLDLLQMLTSTSFVNVTGTELIGRSSAVKWTVRYLLQMGFFRGGCFVIDCKLQSRKYKNKSFNECVFDVLRSCGVMFSVNTLSPFLDDEEELGGAVPMMNYGPSTVSAVSLESSQSQSRSTASGHSLSVSNGGSRHLQSHLSGPSRLSSSGHYSCRSSAVFPNLHTIHTIDELSQTCPDLNSHDPGSHHHLLQPMVATPPIGPVTPILGDPRTSPKSLFEYLDLAPPQHEPCCFVILNMNDWTNGNGPNEVAEWITTASEHLYTHTQEDSRIIYTSNEPIPVKAVSTLNMKALPRFKRPMLARLFKEFCSDFASEFAPSEEEITAHDALQTIFDGLPGMTKRVAQYVRFIIAENSMAERDEEKKEITLDQIARLYPSSDFAASKGSQRSKGTKGLNGNHSNQQKQGTVQQTVQHHPQQQQQQNTVQNTVTARPQSATSSSKPPVALLPKRTSNSLPSQLIGVPPLRQRHLMIDQRHSQTPKLPQSFFKSPTSTQSQPPEHIEHAINALDALNSKLPRTAPTSTCSTPTAILHHNNHYYAYYGQITGQMIHGQMINGQSPSVQTVSYSNHPQSHQQLHSIHSSIHHGVHDQGPVGPPQSVHSHSTHSNCTMNNIHTLHSSSTMNTIPERAGFLNHAAHHQFQPYPVNHVHTVPVPVPISTTASPMGLDSRSKTVPIPLHHTPGTGHSHHGIAQVILQPPIKLHNTCTSPGTLYDDRYVGYDCLPTTDLTFNESVERPRKPVEFRRPNSLPAPVHHDSIRLIAPRPAPSLSLVVTSPPISVDQGIGNPDTVHNHNTSYRYSHSHSGTDSTTTRDVADHHQIDHHDAQQQLALSQLNASSAISTQEVIMENAEGIQYGMNPVTSTSCDHVNHHHITTSHHIHHIPTHRIRNLNKSISEDVSNRIGGGFVDIHKSVELDDQQLARLMHRRSSSVPHLQSTFRISSIRHRHGDVRDSNTNNLGILEQNSNSVHSQSTADSNSSSKEHKLSQRFPIPSPHHMSNVAVQSAVSSHAYNRSNLLRPGHSQVFSSQTMISLSADSVFEQLPPPHSPVLTVSNSWHRKNTSYVIGTKSTEPSSSETTDPITNSTISSSTITAGKHTASTSTNAGPLSRTLGTSTLRLTHPGVGTPEIQSVSAPIIYDNASLTANNTKFKSMALMDDAVIGITSYAARRIWTKSCLATDNMKAKLDDLFPHLVTEFRRLTLCETRHPTKRQIEEYFVKYSGSKQKFIAANKFDSFFNWFRSMCGILKDLRHIYVQVEDYLMGLFYGRTEAEDKLKVQPEGTFLLRLASQQNGLAITYKDQSGRMKNVLLTRVEPEMYKTGKSDKKENIFNLIRSWNKLQYAYTPQKLIRKKFIF